MNLYEASERAGPWDLPLLKWRRMQTQPEEARTGAAGYVLSLLPGDGKECHPTDPFAKVAMARG